MYDFLQYGGFTRVLPGVVSIIVSLSRERVSIIGARDIEVYDPDTLTRRFEKFEENLVAFWDKELRDILFSKTHLELWIQDCHKRRDAYAEGYGFSHAMNVQYRLVEQLSQSEYYGTPEMLSTEAATLVEMYQRFVDHCRSLHPSLQDPALLFLVVELAERETIIKLKDVCEVAVIRTLFTQLSNAWQGLAVSYAIIHDCAYAVEAYVDAGFNIDQRMESGMSILHVAIKQKSHDTVLSLIKRGADVFAINPRNGWSALHYGVCSADSRDSILRTLLNSGLSGLVLLADHDNVTALDMAQKWKSSKSIELLQDAMARQRVS